MVKTDSNASGLLKTLRITGLTVAILSISLGSFASPRNASNQETFASPEQAAAALSAAWHSGNKARLLKIFGPAGAKLVSSGDLIADKEARARLAAEYDVQHKVETISDQQKVLVIGQGAFPYPIPLTKHGNVWSFDTQAGEEEILDRRIGRNELNAIEVCRAYVEAQREYAAKDPLGNGRHEYAKKISSANDKHDGLYWRTMEGEEESPLGPLAASAAAEGYDTANSHLGIPYHGYYYRILTRQGANAPGGASDYIVDGHMTKGFALVAFPAKYGNSGVMTFIVNQDGIVFEKNLGPLTAKIARQMPEYNPDQTWKMP